MELLTYVKTSLRIKSADEQMDGYILALCEAAKLDLTRTANISADNFDDDELVPLLNQAIALFVGYNFVADQNVAEKLRRTYDDLKGKLAVSQAYTDSED